MTIHDIRNYLEKIYKIDVVNITTRIALGKTRQDTAKGYVVKDDDIKYAYVTLVLFILVIKIVFGWFIITDISASRPKVHISKFIS